MIANKIVIEPFSVIEKNHPELVAVDAEGQCTGQAMDFCKLFLNTLLWRLADRF